MMGFFRQTSLLPLKEILIRLFLVVLMVSSVMGVPVNTIHTHEESESACCQMEEMATMDSCCEMPEKAPMKSCDSGSGDDCRCYTVTQVALLDTYDFFVMSQSYAVQYLISIENLQTITLSPQSPPPKTV